MSTPQVPPGSPELHEKLLQQAAWWLIRHGRDSVAEKIRQELAVQGWRPDAGEAYARQIAALAANWTLDQAGEYFRAFQANGSQAAEEADVITAQRKLRTGRKAAERDAAEQAAAEPRAVIRSGAWLTGQQFGPVAWAVPGLAPEGVFLLGGPPKGGKSWLALAVALALAAGREVLGALRNGGPRPVLYLALEDSDRRMQYRCAKLGYDEVPALFEYITECRPGRVLGEIGDWLEAHRGRHPLVIIDTWGKIMTPALKGESMYDRDYRLGGEVKALAKAHPDATVWINHHVRKQGSADFLDTISGTQGVAGAPDTVAVLVRRRYEDHGRLHVTGRDVEENTYQLEDYPCWRLEGGSLGEAATAARAAADRESLGPRASAILDLLASRGQVSTGDVAKALEITSDQASVYLGRLEKAGKIVKPGRGLWESTRTPVGSVGSVGNTGISQPTQQAIQGKPPPVDWEECYRIAEMGLRERREDT